MAPLVINTRVDFLGWDEQRKDEFEGLNTDHFVGGIILRVERGNTYLVQWDTGYRSLHFENEIEEHIEPAIKVESPFKIWLRERKYRRIRDKVTRKIKYYRDENNNKLTRQKVREEYEYYECDRIIFKRLFILARLDGDYAHEENGVGFSKYDTGWGHKLVDAHAKWGKFTPNQLAAAVKLQHKYRVQLRRVMGELYENIVEFPDELKDKELDYYEDIIETDENKG